MDGYNGEGSGFAAALGQDVLNFAPAGIAIKALRAVKLVRGAKISTATANKIHHIFSKDRHNLADVVRRLGGEEKAFSAIEKATKGAVNSSKPGKFEVIVKVGGEQVTVRGRVMEGQVKIGTAFAKKRGMQ